MKKITQSALAVSLSATMLIQNMVVISHAEKINANKIEKNSSISSTEHSLAQVDPETIPQYIVWEKDISTYSLSNELPDLKTKSLINSNSIGCWKCNCK